MSLVLELAAMIGCGEVKAGRGRSAKAVVIGAGLLSQALV